eukprot:364686-Chlamydomonas_euryale.AAC.14
MHDSSNLLISPQQLAYLARQNHPGARTQSTSPAAPARAPAPAPPAAPCAAAAADHRHVPPQGRPRNSNRRQCV